MNKKEELAKNISNYIKMLALVKLHNPEQVDIIRHYGNNIDEMTVEYLCCFNEYSPV